MSRPLLTAALIVRDESIHIADCLTSLRGAVDEVVVVDTGSTDETPAIAAAHGARVLHHPWTGDFAAARNFGLDHARGDWILYIDADERLRPVAPEVLRRLLGDPGMVGYRVRLHLSSGLTATLEYRLFRNDPRIRFRGRIHESIPPALAEVAQSDGLAIGRAPEIVIDHLGYEGDQTHKHRRNLPLLEAQLAADPSRIYNWHHLGRIRAAMGAHAGAVEAWERGIELARRSGSKREGVLPFIELIGWREGAGEPWFDLLDEARSRYPGHLLLDWLHGRRLMAEERWAEAIEQFQALAAIDPDELVDERAAYDRRIFGVFAQESMGTAWFRLGRFAESAAAYALAEALDPDDPGHRVRRLLAEARAGIPAAAARS